jgi:hypothetical protein
MIGGCYTWAPPRLGLDKRHPLRTDLFTPPARPGQQLRLL